VSSVTIARNEQMTDDGPLINKGPSVVCRLLSVPGPELKGLLRGPGSAFRSLSPGAGTLYSRGRVAGPGYDVMIGDMVPAASSRYPSTVRSIVLTATWRMARGLLDQGLWADTPSENAN
jgi:hypothetical protein